jgi:hypothetical protein
MHPGGEQYMNTQDYRAGIPGVKNLYRLGAIAPLVTLSLYIIQTLVIILGDMFWEPFPTTVESWLQLFGRNKILGLFYLNALDIVSISLLGIMFLALYRALKAYDRVLMPIAAGFAFIGITVFTATRSLTLSVLGLSDQYAAASTETQKTLIAAAARVLDALGIATPQTTGFFFMAAAVFILSLVIVKSGIFNRFTAYVGVLTAVITFISDAGLLLFASVSAVLMGISGLFWLVWYMAVSIGLFKLAGGKNTSG